MISHVDAAHVKVNCPGSRIWVIPNGVDTEYFHTKNHHSDAGRNLLFTGVMNYTPNVESIVYFIKEILPLVRRRISDVKLTVAGRNPTLELQKIEKEVHEISLTGYVDDIRPYFERAAIYVAPIISGAGLKNKILEAWSMSKAVVATSLSCDGIDAIDGYNVVIADRPKDFAEKVVQLLSDTNMRDRLAINGRHTVERSYSWLSKSKMLENLFREVLHRNAE